MSLFHLFHHSKNEKPNNVSASNKTAKKSSEVNHKKVKPVKKQDRLRFDSSRPGQLKVTIPASRMHKGSSSAVHNKRSASPVNEFEKGFKPASTSSFTTSQVNSMNAKYAKTPQSSHVSTRPESSAEAVDSKAQSASSSLAVSLSRTDHFSAMHAKQQRMAALRSQQGVRHTVAQGRQSSQTASASLGILQAVSKSVFASYTDSLKSAYNSSASSKAKSIALERSASASSIHSAIAESTANRVAGQSLSAAYSESASQMQSLRSMISVSQSSADSVSASYSLEFEKEARRRAKVISAQQERNTHLDNLSSHTAVKGTVSADSLFGSMSGPANSKTARLQSVISQYASKSQVAADSLAAKRSQFKKDQQFYGDQQRKYNQKLSAIYKQRKAIEDKYRHRRLTSLRADEIAIDSSIAALGGTSRAQLSSQSEEISLNRAASASASQSLSMSVRLSHNASSYSQKIDSLNMMLHKVRAASEVSKDSANASQNKMLHVNKQALGDLKSANASVDALKEKYRRAQRSERSHRKIVSYYDKLLDNNNNDIKQIRQQLAESHKSLQDMISRNKRLSKNQGYSSQVLNELNVLRGRYQRACSQLRYYHSISGRNAMQRIHSLQSRNHSLVTRMHYLEGQNKGLISKDRQSQTEVQKHRIKARKKNAALRNIMKQAEQFYKV